MKKTNSLSLSQAKDPIVPLYLLLMVKESRQPGFLREESRRAKDLVRYIGPTLSSCYYPGK